jgi:hypothetical protein
MPPVTVLVTNVPYLVGDSASAAGGVWYNAGDFGDGKLDNADANNAFYASLGIRVPYAFSDLFNAMDAWPVDPLSTGDGFIRYNDWQVILQRSLGLNTNNWLREWSAGGYLIDFSTNLPPQALVKVPEGKTTPAWPWYRQALVGGMSVGNVVPGQAVSVPVYVKLQNGSTLGGLQFLAQVTPQNGAPALAQAPQFSLAAGVAASTFQVASPPGQTGHGWALGSFNFLSDSSNFLGWVTFTVPATAQAGQVYTLSFGGADGSPDLNSEYDFETRSAYVAVSAPAPQPSICSDEWKVCFFGSLTNPSAADSADPDGDGVPNWMEYLAGTDPTDAKSKLHFSSAAKQVVSGRPQVTLQWLTAPGKAYQVQWATRPGGGAWSALTTVSGNGAVASCADTNTTAAARFYRLQVLP